MESPIKSLLGLLRLSHDLLVRLTVLRCVGGWEIRVFACMFVCICVRMYVYYYIYAELSALHVQC